MATGKHPSKSLTILGDSIGSDSGANEGRWSSEEQVATVLVVDDEGSDGAWEEGSNKHACAQMSSGRLFWMDQRWRVTWFRW